jgi:glucose/arabinose dehydrogenase
LNLRRRAFELSSRRSGNNQDYLMMPPSSCFVSRLWSLVFVCCLVMLAAAPLVRAQSFAEAGFVAETVATLPPYKPVGLAFAPDGRIFIWQEDGIVRIFKNGALLPTPFINLQPRVNTVNDRGLLGLALDPNFASNGYVYLLYTYEENHNPNSIGPKTSRLTRVTANPSNTDVALANSEVVILGSIGTAPCSNYPAGSDCIPSDSDSHTVGTLRFAPDGKLFVGIGDGASYAATDPLALRAQDLNSYAGKILRINRDGSAPGDNPFDDGTDSIRSKVYSYGLRNPYRFSLHPVTGEVYMGEVGWNDWEEINRGRGANFGWPCYEGHQPQAQYQEEFVLCQQLAPSAVTPPLYAYSHDEGVAAIGGVFYNATQFPAQYRGSYYFADYGGEFIRRMTFDAQGHMLGVQNFATGVVAPVAMEMGPDGALYYVSLSTGQIRRIRYSGPVAEANATPLWGYSPLNVSFSSAGSSNPSGGSLNYLWDFGDGATSTAPNPSHTYTSGGVRTFNARLTVTNTQGQSATDNVLIAIGSTPPTATILSPANGTQVRAGDVVSYQGMATDPDQNLPPGALSWAVLLHHNDHVHPHSTATGAGGSFIVAEHGVGTYSYEIVLTATDSSGLTNRKSITLPVASMQVPSPWVSRDIGNVGTFGSAGFSNGTFSIQGSGTDIWNTSDSFQFVYQPLSGDGEIAARVSSLEETHSNAKAGVMIRETLTPDSRHAILNVTPTAGIEFMQRLSPGDITSYTPGGNEPAPRWLKLTRAGNLFSAYKSNNGTSWTLIGTSNISMTANVYIGMAVTGHNDPVLCTAMLDNVIVRTFGGNNPPTVNITTPANGATFTAPASITINATANDSDGTVSRVDFYAGTNLIGTDTTAPYSFTWNNVAAGNYALTAQATDNVGATTTSGVVNVTVNTSGGTPALTDDFNDNTQDTAKWTLGTIQGAIYSGPSAWDASITVLERNQRLEISPRANVTGDHYNGYVSVAGWNLTNSRASVEAIQVATGSASNTQLALCLDSQNFYMISVEGAQLRFEQVVGSLRTTTSIAYNAAQHRFWRIRHEPSSDSIVFETSSDGQTWAVRRTVARQFAISALKVEISAGTWAAVSSPATAIFDNFRLESNGGGPVNNPPTVNITSPANGATFTAPASITIAANANDSDGTVSRVDFYAGTNLIGTDSNAPYSFVWNNVSAGSYALTAQAIDNAGALTTSTPVNITVNGVPTLPAPWSKTDIGSVGFAGDASFAGGVFTVRGSGADIWDNADAFHYVYQPLNGNGQIVARVTGVQLTDEWAKAGVMIRETLTSGSRHASMFLTAGNGLAFQRRANTGGISDHNSGGSGVAPYWVRLVRSGNLFSAYRSTDGTNWVQVGPSVSISMTANVYVGLAVTSHNNSASCTSAFDNVSVTTGLVRWPLAFK